MPAAARTRFAEAAPLLAIPPQRTPIGPALIADWWLQDFASLGELAARLAKVAAGRPVHLTAAALTWGGYDTFMGFTVRAFAPGGEPDYLGAVYIGEASAAELTAAIDRVGAK